MRRREFVIFLGGAVASWSSEARVLPSERMRRIGVLMGFRDDA